MFDFANILFSGPCNAHCPFCIGQQIDPALNTPNLERYPPLNLEVFIGLVWQHAIRQVVFTGSNTDPQRYCHEERLLKHLRQRLPTGTQFSLHTNALLALEKMKVLNQYDRISISLPSFNQATYHRMMGRSAPPDLEAVLSKATIPIKISCVVTKFNKPEIPAFLEHCQGLGVRRVVLRKLYGDTRPWSAILPWKRLPFIYIGNYRGNPVLEFKTMEVTLWDFSATRSTAINLFANGYISTQYLISEARSKEIGNREVLAIASEGPHTYHNQLSS